MSTPFLISLYWKLINQQKAVELTMELSLERILEVVFVNSYRGGSEGQLDARRYGTVHIDTTKVFQRIC